MDHAGADPWHGGTGGVVWRGGDPRPVPLIPAVAGLTAVGTLMDEDEDAEEKRRRMEAKIAAENFGAIFKEKIYGIACSKLCYFSNDY